MHYDKNMQKVIDGKRYNAKTATLIASDEYWDGSNFERNGRNEFLLQTKNGAFFTINVSQWDGERDSLRPVSLAEAKELYAQLPEHFVEYEEAFAEIPEEAGPGRPAMFGEKMAQTAIYLTDEQKNWLKEQGGINETVRRLIDEAMK